MKIFKSKWGKWETLAIGEMNATYYLLQAKKHENGKVRFRVERSTSAYGINLSKVTENFQSKL